MGTVLRFIAHFATSPGCVIAISQDLLRRVNGLQSDVTHCALV
jgi:hypothetical protein